MGGKGPRARHTVTYTHPHLKRIPIPSPPSPPRPPRPPPPRSYLPPPERERGRKEAMT